MPLLQSTLLKKPREESPLPIKTRTLPEELCHPSLCWPRDRQLQPLYCAGLRSRPYIRLMIPCTKPMRREPHLRCGRECTLRIKRNEKGGDKTTSNPIVKIDTCNCSDAFSTLCNREFEPAGVSRRYTTRKATRFQPWLLQNRRKEGRLCQRNPEWRSMLEEHESVRLVAH